MWEFIWFFLSPRQRKLVIWSVALFVGYTVTGFLILPPIIRSVAASQLTKQLDREVTIQKVKLNPFALSATVRGLLIKDKDGKPFVSWDEVYVNFQLSSLIGKAWTFREISTTKPFVRAQLNRDGTFNFSDLIAKFSANAPDAAPRKPSKPLVLHIGRLHIGGAAAAFSDLTTRKPFTRIIGPLDVTLENFRTDSDSKNPYSFAGVTDAGETFAWSGYFYLDPLRSRGELSLDKISLNKYAPLYQDFVKFEIRDGTIAMRASYRFELSATNRVIAVTNALFVLRDFKLGQPGDSNSTADLPLFGVSGVSVDIGKRQAEIGSVFARAWNIFLNRNRDNAINVVELSKPGDTTASAPGGILVLLRSVTNAVAMLLESTNQWSGTIHDVDFSNCAVHLEDLVNLRPAKLDLNDIALSVKNISNVPTTNLTAALSLRWNTNGTIRTGLAASFSPPTADINLAITNLNLGTLDPYLEPKLNLLILGSKLGLTGQLQLRTPPNELPQVTFSGDARLDDLHTADGAMGEDLLKWDSLRFSGIDANLNPQVVTIKEIALDNAYARVVIETNHMINLLAALQPANTNTPVGTNASVVAKQSSPPATNEVASAAAPKISIGSIVISNAAFRFTDHSITPDVNFAIEQLGGTIDGISSEQLQHADIHLHALVDNVGPADITGHINPFGGTQTNEIKVSVNDVDLTPTSPYAGKFAGYRIARGKLNLDLEYEIVGKKLNSKNVITLDQFTFGEKVDSPDATHLPVRLAVAIMKDRAGKIVLDVPVEGSLDDPQFRVRKVIARAIMNILEKAATSPFSLLGAVFGGGGEELGYQDFAPGSVELTTASQQKLDSLVKGLYERPALQLEISGSVDAPTDRDALQRVALEKQLRTRQWLSLGKADRASTTPDQVVLTPGQRTSWVQKLYSEAQAAGKITPAFVATNSHLAAAVAQIIARRADTKKGASLLMKSDSAPNPSSAADVSTQSKLPPPTNPMEVLLLASIPVSDSDLEAIAAGRAKAVRAYILQTGKVEDARLFLAENQTGGVRSDGSRVYLQFQ
ncbi:MAG: DUF748 domain-containing protein [Verrucomicrobiales bacterium]|nr:DUF748 domain-containing protein [Verrucomicrobiales bacterium]